MTTLRIIHRDDPAPVKAAAFASANPMASVPESPRVWVNGRELVPFTDWATFVATVRKTKLIFNADLLHPKYDTADRAAMLTDLAKRLKASGVNPKLIAFITDWEKWGPLGSGEADFKWWYSIMQAWPGQIGNYGNAEGKHVEEHPGNRVALSWPWLRDIPGNRGVSCPSAYGLGLSPNGLKKTIAVCRSTRKPNPPKARRVVAFICDDAFHRGEGMGTQADYIKAAGNADKIIWNISATHDAAKFPDFKAADRLEQDAISAKNLKIARAIGRDG